MLFCSNPCFLNIKTSRRDERRGGITVEKDKLVQYVAELVLAEIRNIEIKNRIIPVGISARHIHLSQKDVETLFGSGYKLTFFKPLSQPGQFAAKETLELIGPKGIIKKVRVLGPVRPRTQVEISLSDARSLGITPPVRNSGDIEETPGVILRGPRGELQIECGVIIAERHVHMTHREAESFGLNDGEHIRVFVDGKKGGVLEHITVRVSDSYALDLHIDTDDANAFGLVQGQKVRFEKMDK